MSIYLHIGYPKTASSWLQEKFWPYVTNIRTYDRKYIRQYLLDPGAFDFNPEETKKLFKTEGDVDIWLSEELLLGRLRPGGVKGFVSKEIANRLKLVFPNAKIILFIRNQIEILASAYLQYVRSGGNYSVNKFLYPENYFGKDGNRLVLLGIDYFLYDRTIDYYCKLFGKENVHIYLFEDFAKEPKVFIALFADKFNLKYSEESIDFAPVNMGYRKFLIFTRRLTNIFSRSGPLNKYYLFHIPRIDFFCKRLHTAANQYRIFGERPNCERLLGQKNIKFLKKYYALSNRILRDEFKIEGLEKYNYPL